MKRAMVLLAAALAVAGCGSRPYPPATANAYDYADADLFYHDLAPYGEWVDVRSYGRCWRPYRVGSEWQPYTEGHWEYTEYGWTWVSDEPWGWAPYHYGRWFYEPAHGWLWVPGRQWAPAWVVWRRGGGWVGWAPAPPGWGPTINERRTFIEPRHYCFVEERRFADPRMREVVTRRNPGLVNSTRDVTNYTVTDNHVANHSIGVDEIEKVAGRRIQRHHVADFEQAAPRHVLLPKERGYEQQRPIAPATQQHSPIPQPGVEDKRDANFGAERHRQREIERREFQRREAERRNVEQREAERRLEERRMPPRGADFERRPAFEPKPERAPAIERRSRVSEPRAVEQQRRPEAPTLGVRAPGNVPVPAEPHSQPAKPTESRQTGKPGVVPPEALRPPPPVNQIVR